MANELLILPNPTNVPEAVSTGYQRQNTNLFVLQTGLDTLNPIYNTSQITVEGGGCFEINGCVFKLMNTITLNIDNPDLPVFVAVSDNGDGTASIYLSDSQGVWNNSKQGFYLDNGTRTTNKYSTRSFSDVGTIVYSKNTKGNEFISLPAGKYRVVLQSGLGGGDGGPRSIGSVAVGGVPNINDTVTTEFIHCGNKKIQVKVGGNGYKGGDGGRGFSNFLSSYGYSGGSGAGEESELVGIAKTKRIFAGRSGSGQYESFAGIGGPGASGEDIGLPGYNGDGGGYGFGGGGNGGTAYSEGYGGAGGGGSGGIGGDGGGGISGHGVGALGGNSVFNGDGEPGKQSNPGSGAGGGAGGAPGWQRNDGDTNAGSITIWRL
jgi:hypothetical protein